MCSSSRPSCSTGTAGLKALPPGRHRIRASSRQIARIDRRPEIFRLNQGTVSTDRFALTLVYVVRTQIVDPRATFEKQLAMPMPMRERLLHVLVQALLILLRGDSGFTRETLMAWCEANRVDYVFGLARNDRLEKAIIPELITATIESIRTGRTARCFKDFSYTTLDSWSRERRVIGKAEVTGGEANPRFVVTSLKRSEAGARHLYEKTYCARGDMENRIKECQLDLFADRTSTATMQANQLRLWFASMAYVLLCALRRIGLAHSQFADATCGTIRLKLLKLGALVRVSVRRIKIAMASACPWQDEFALAHARLRNAIG